MWASTRLKPFADNIVDNAEMMIHGNLVDGKQGYLPIAPQC